MLALEVLLTWLLAVPICPEPVSPEPVEPPPAAFAYFPEPSRETVLLFTGDNLLGARMTREIAQRGEDYPYEHVAEVLRAGDLCFGNLECPITSYAKKTPGKSWESIQAGRNFVFKADPAYSGRLLAEAGFDVVSLANNHAMDYCAEGLLETLGELDAAGIRRVGAGADRSEAEAPAVIELDGLRVGYLGYSMIIPAQSAAGEARPGINSHPRQFSDEMAQAIGALKAQCDIAVVTCHWGVECQYYPTSYQKDVARQAVEAGADIVIGHHPHRMQGVELYEDAVIAYSLGNFMFTGKSQLIESAVLRVTVKDGAIVEAALLPVWVRSGQPQPSDEEKLVNKLKKICEPFSVTLEAAEDGWYVVRGQEVRGEE